MKPRLFTAFNPEARLQGRSVTGPTGTRVRVTAAAAAAIAAAVGGDLTAAFAGAMPLTEALMVVEELRAALALCRTLEYGGRVVARALPAGEDFVLSAPTHAPARAAWRLSRFAYLRREGARWMLESPRAHARIHVLDAALWPALAGSAPAKPLTAALFDMLAAARMLEDAEETRRLRAWAFHDLLFHARHRAGRHAAPHGAVPGRTALPAPRAIVAGSALLPLPRPRRGAPALAPLDVVLQRRRSRPRQGAAAMSRRELGEFFFHCARATRRRDGRERRPYPAAGGVYELEIHAAVHRCQDLPPGMYRYDARAHALAPVAPEGDGLQRLLRAAGRATRAPMPQILIVLAARFDAINTRYASIAYALILKDAGVLQQTMCLTAAALGLAACPVGCGDSDLFARATGRGYYTEGAVAELTLGRP